MSGKENGEEERISRKLKSRRDRKWTERLVNLPESGMGYQRVNIRFANNQLAQNVLVFNAEEAELPEELARMPIRDIELRKS